MDILSTDKKSDNELEFELFEDDVPNLDVNAGMGQQALESESESEPSKDEYPIIWYEPDIHSDEKKLIQENNSVRLFTEFTEALQFTENLGTGFLLITSNEIDEEKLLKDFGPLRETYGRRYFDFEEEAVLVSLLKGISKERMKSLKVYVFFTREEFFNEIPVHEKEEEVMIMCDVKEMAKQFQEEFTIFWCDPNLSSALERKEVLLIDFDIQEENISVDFESLLKDLENYNGPPYHLILFGGQISTETIVNRIENLKDLLGVYIYESPPLVTNWKSPERVKIEKSLEGLIPKIIEGIRTNSKLKNTFPAFATQFDDWDKSHINKVYYYLRGFINFNNRKQAKRDFINLGKKVYQSQRLFQFEKEYVEYHKDKMLKWYTADSPIFKLINNCLRISTSDSILYCRFALKDLERAIREEYQQQRYSGVVYRGAYMSKDEFEKLEKNIGKEIEMYGFLSTSKNLNTALRFLDSDTENKVLITIIIPPFLFPELDEQGFADVSKFSEFLKEEEILFNVRSRFQVVKIGRTQTQKGTECRHLVLLYGAQLLRKYMTIENPVISLKFELPLEFKCNYCESEEGLLVMTEGTQMVCRECSVIGKSTVSKSSLFLPINTKVELSEQIRSLDIKGKFFSFGKEAKLVYECIYQCNDCLESGKERFKKWLNFENEKIIVECLECFRKNKESKLGYVLLQEEDMQMFWNKRQEKWEKMELELKKEELEELKKCDGADIFRIVQDNQKCREFCKLTLQKLARKAKREKRKIAKYVDLGKSSNHLGDREKALECTLKALDIRKSIYGEQDSETAASYRNLASVYESLGDSHKALQYNLRDLNIIKSIHGETDLKTATSYNNIALVYTTLGNYQIALEYNLKALDIKKSTYGETHPHIGTSYNNVALVYKNLGDYQKAIEYHTKALDITRFIYGETNSETAASYNNLASVHDDLGEHQKAIEYQLKALEIIKSIYGETHFRAATVYNNLASTYKNLGENQKAVECSLRALNITNFIFGETHPETATSYNDLASAYQCLGDYKKALEHFLKALDLRKSIYGETHPQTAGSYNNLASLYDKMGNYQKALEFNLKSLEITKSIFGETHLNTATSYNNLAMIHSNSRDFQKALEFHLKALDIRKSIGGEKHPETAISYNNLAPAYQGLGENKKALKCLLVALDIFKSAYGETHPQIATSYDNIGLTYQELGQFQKALEYNLKALDLTKSIHGETHPDIAISYNNLGMVYSSLGDLPKALEFHLKAVNIHRSVFGEIHPHMAASYANLSFLYFNLKDHQKAIEYNLKALDITKSVYGEIHPQTLFSYQNIAAMFQNLGYYLKAKEFHMKALEVNKSIDEKRKKDSEK